MKRSMGSTANSGRARGCAKIRRGWHVVRRGETRDPWLAGMLARKPKKVIAVALANRTARRVWALATRKEDYRLRAAA